MATVSGRDEVKRLFATTRMALETKLLRGAARAAAKVVAEEAKARSISQEVSNAIKIATAQRDGRVIAKVQVKGTGAYIAPWLEYGTAPHFISVDDSQRQGMSVGRINKAHAAGSLVINGQFVGTTVFHPGARPHPFLRPALDTKEGEAIAAAQAYITSKIKAGRFVATADAGDDET
ncbi:MAG TPA: HK97 gp10 family phage protein [Sphingobium sp.]|uniref:HK97 gp10 family phage protein n=1 Tax=Sphingobium sp. TaxID=1912891 RepID=UPI002ED30751